MLLCVLHKSVERLALWLTTPDQRGFPKLLHSQGKNYGIYKGIGVEQDIYVLLDIRFGRFGYSGVFFDFEDSVETGAPNESVPHIICSLEESCWLAKIQVFR